MVQYLLSTAKERGYKELMYYSSGEAMDKIGKKTGFSIADSHYFFFEFNCKSPVNDFFEQQARLLEKKFSIEAPVALQLVKSIADVTPILKKLGYRFILNEWEALPSSYFQADIESKRIFFNENPPLVVQVKPSVKQGFLVITCQGSNVFTAAVGVVAALRLAVKDVDLLKDVKTLRVYLQKDSKEKPVEILELFSTYEAFDSCVLLEYSNTLQ